MEAEEAEGGGDKDKGGDKGKGGEENKGKDNDDTYKGNGKDHGHDDRGKWKEEFNPQTGRIEGHYVHEPPATSAEPKPAPNNGQSPSEPANGNSEEKHDDPVSQNRKGNTIIDNTIQIASKIIKPLASASAYLNGLSPKRIIAFGPNIQTVASRARSIANSTSGIVNRVAIKGPLGFRPMVSGAGLISKTGAFLKPLVRAAPAISGIALLSDIAFSHRLQSSHILSGAAVGVAFIAVIGAPAVAATAGTIGLLYLGADISSKIFTGSSLGDHLNNWTDKKGVSKEGGTLIKW